MFKTSKNGEILVISLKEPYKNLKEIISYTDTIYGETDVLYYKKEFSYSTDGVLYNDYRILSDSFLQQIALDPSNEFWIKYRYTQVGDGELSLESITLEGETDDGMVQAAPMCGDSSSADACCGIENLVYECDCNNNLFNPYATGNAENLYNQLSQIVSSMFGICVLYFKTKADQRSKDVVLREYSLENVISQGNIKILVPNNQLPTREINFNPLMLNFTSVFEVHIAKKQFQKIFGKDSRPEVHDYLYFELYLNRMFEINAVSEPDDFMFEGSYWRVSLTSYQQRASVKTEPGVLKIDGNDLIVSSDKFNEETEEQGKDTNHHDTNKTPTTIADQWYSDKDRMMLSKKMTIQHNNIMSQWVVISKDWYCLDSVKKEDFAVVYRYNKGWGSEEERMFSMWFNLQPSLYRRYDISDINQSPEGNIQLILTANVSDIREEDYVYLKGVSGCVNLQKIKGIKDNIVTLYCPYSSDISFNSATLFSAKLRKTIYNDNFSLLVSEQCTVAEINGNSYFYRISDNLETERWYCIVYNMNISQGNSQVQIFAAGENKGAPLKEVSVKQNVPIVSEELPDSSWKLSGSDIWVTNIRIFSKMCSEEQIKNIIMQYRVKDNHLCLLADNASSELLLDTVTNPR